MTKLLDNGGSLAVDRSSAGGRLVDVDGRTLPRQCGPRRALPDAGRRRAVSARLEPPGCAAGLPGPARPTR